MLVSDQLRYLYSDLQVFRSQWGAALAKLQECEVRSGLDGGGHIKGVSIICRPNGESCEFVAWLRPSWKRGYHLLHTFRFRGIRTYKNLNLLAALLREEWGYRGPITLYMHDDPDLAFSAFEASRRDLPSSQSEARTA